MDVKEYLRAVTPINILDVFNESALVSLLNGYSFALGSGMTVIYSPGLHAAMETLERKDALERDFLRTFNRLCAYWRDSGGCGKGETCLQADKIETMKYYSGEWSGPRIYRCQPLGLWDMSYPLVIGEQILGVLFGGQIVVTAGEVDWRASLRDYNDIVDWETCPKLDDHQQTLRKNIAERVPPRQRDQMLRILESNPDVQSKNVDVDGLKKRVSDFLHFGEITQQLINELHTAKRSAAEHKLLRDCDRDLTNIELTDLDQWWEECGTKLKSLTDTRIKMINLYVRHHSRFLCRISIPDGQSNCNPLPSGEVISAFPVSQLTLLTSAKNKSLLEKIGLDHQGVWGYREEAGAGSEVCSTLMVLQGNIPADRQSLLDDLCSVICTDANLANLIFREREADQQYRHGVSIIGHAFRTPLQALQFHLEDLHKASAITGSPDLLKKVNNGMNRIEDASEDLTQLLGSSKPVTETFNLVEVLNYVITSLEPLAKNHPCAIVRSETWPEQVPVHGVRYRVQRALTRLLENAIKYSYAGTSLVTGKLYEVSVGVMTQNDYIKTVMTNYGIGIPEEKLDKIRQYGYRGQVVDEKRVRLGQGLGLPFAIEAFEELGGYINLTSVPSETATEEERKKYLRYITTVEAGLPITRRK